MKKIIIVLIMVILLITTCTNTNGDDSDLSTDNENDNMIKDNEIIEKPRVNDDIDISEYLTGEIITDGIYTYPSKGFGIIYFVPDKESSKIIKEKYNVTGESLQLKYDDFKMVEKLPKELGIYKVKVNIKLHKQLVLNDIQLTDKIGTVVYKGRIYETNELDENVKVKDNICGLIIKWIFRDDEGGLQILFAGEIESEGYYSISNDLMYSESIGRVYFDEEYTENIPYFVGEKRTNFSFFKTNELFDELQSFSSFGKGRFKTSNYLLIYNIGMGRPVSEKLTEIIFLDEDYKDMFIFDENRYLSIVGDSKEFIIVSLANYDDNQNNISTDYYYVNKNNPEKLFLFSSNGYNYEFKSGANENDFILSTDGYNYIKGENNKAHIIKLTVIENRVVSERIEDL